MMPSFAETKEIWENEFGFCTASFNRCQKKQKRRHEKKGRNNQLVSIFAK